MSNSSQFGGVSVIAIGDLLQLPPVNQQGIYMCPKNGTYESFQESVWQNLFVLHELTEIVRQRSDPEFAELLKRLREGKNTQHDIEIMKGLDQTDTSTWPTDYVKLFLINHLVNKTNMEALTNLGSEVFDIIAEDSVHDLETRRCKISISDLETGNLPTNLKIGVGTGFMLTSNLNTQDKLNGSIVTVKYLNFNRNYPLKDRIFVKFDNPEAGNSLKDHAD